MWNVGKAARKGSAQEGPRAAIAGFSSAKPVIGIARFYAVDRYRPRATRDEIDALLFKMENVTAWRFHELGEVAVEYRSDLLSDQTIETALEGLGYRLLHISDDPQLPEGDVERALGQMC